VLRLGVSVRLKLRLGLRLGSGLSFTFSFFLSSILRSSGAPLLHHKWHLNKFSNFKIHKRICSYCL